MDKNIYFINYASGPFVEKQKRNSLFARIFLRPKKVISCSKNDIDDDFKDKYNSILSQKRGDGYWLWKPYLINKYLEEIAEGDYLIYYDSGIGFRYLNFLKPKAIIKWMKNNNTDIFAGIAIPENGKNENWTKSDLFERMNCDNKLYRDRPQIQATFSIFKASQKSKKFVKSWLDFSCDAENITDIPSVKPNAEGFIEHRHDQSVLTNLVYLENIPVFNSEVVLFNKSLSFVELWQRSKVNFIYRIFYKLAVKILNCRK